MSESILLPLTPDSLREVLQQVGYRAELMTDRPTAPYIRSATGGVPFEVQFVNRMPGDQASYADITFVVVLRAHSEFPLDVINRWNNAKRFGRLRLSQDLLVLDMDMTGLGHVTRENFKAHIGIWDQLVQELLPHLQNTMATPATAIRGAPTPPIGAPSQQRIDDSSANAMAPASANEDGREKAPVNSDT